MVKHPNQSQPNPDISDTGYSDTVRSSPLTSDTFLNLQLDLYTIKMFGYSDTVRSSPLTVTLSGEACISL